MRNIFVSFLTFLLFSATIGATNNESIEWDTHLNTLTNKSDQILSFSDCYYDDNNVPHYTKIIPLDNVDIDNVKIKVISSDQYMISNKDSIISDSISNDYVINYRTATSKHKNFLALDIIPIKKINSTTLTLIKEFTIEVSQTLKTSDLLKSADSKYAANSVLSTGDWIKISIDQTGVHKISFSQLADWGFKSPEKVKIYGNGGKMLPSYNGTERSDDLIECKYLQKDNAIYFYAEGPYSWDYNTISKKYTHEIHNFSDVSYYFLTESEEGYSAIESMNYNKFSSTYESTSYDINYFHEKQLVNIIQSGSEWYGEAMNNASTSTLNFPISLPNLDTSEPISLIASVVGRSSSSSTFTLQFNNNSENQLNINTSSVTLDNHEGYYASKTKSTKDFFIEGDNLTLNIKYSSASSDESKGWLDFFTIQGRGILSKQNGKQFIFNDAQSVGNNYTTFKIKNCDASTIVWNITDLNNPTNINYTYTDETLQFCHPTNELQSFIAFKTSDAIYTPSFVAKIENQDLHSLNNIEYVIVSHPDFLEQAKKLASFHEEHSNLSTVVVTPVQIYNEFSSGKPDNTAIRSFMKMFYDRSAISGVAPKYLLLFGDGSYDNRLEKNNTYKILTYQSKNSIHYTKSYVSDDYFGFLDDEEGKADMSDMLDIGIGRFPVDTESEATNAVNKTIDYMLNQDFGSWRKQLTFIGDDGDNNTHMTQSNQLTQIVNNEEESFDINKIFFDSYNMVTTTKGKRYPDVENSIYQAIDNGTLIFNYTGHGAEFGLSHEKVITQAHIASWSNYQRLALFITATCEFSRFDDHEYTSAGENVFLNDHGGAIALLTTTRLVYASPNFTLNKKVYSTIFRDAEDGKRPSFGDIIRKAKVAVGSDPNKLNFTLLGDPAIKLLYPKQKIATLKLNNTSLSESTDTLKALSSITLSGIIVDEDENILSDFNGEMEISVYDKPVSITTLSNDNNPPFTYSTYLDAIFQGNVTIEDGEFETTLFIPKDIQKNFGNGRISYYAKSDNYEDAFGSTLNFTIGGLNSEFEEDNLGPQITLWLNGKSSDEKIRVNDSPLLKASIEDIHGINTSGTGIGHDLSIIIDNDKSNALTLNSYFKTSANTYMEGSVNYQLPKLASGKHTLTLKAWDAYNNSNSETITFWVVDGNELTINDILLYPNPLSNDESCYLSFNHNDPNAILYTTIELYSLDGNKIYSNTIDQYSDGISSNLIEVNNINNQKVLLQPGFYICNVIIETSNGKKGKMSQKFMVIQ